MDHLSVLLARHITLDEYRKRRMGNILKAAGMGMTPEVHAASCIVKAGVTAILILPVYCSCLLRHQYRFLQRWLFISENPEGRKKD
mgnify:CR=1 FL=1